MCPSSRHLDETAGNNIDTLCHGGDVLAVGDSFYDTQKCGYFGFGFGFSTQGDGTNFGLWADYVLCPDDTAVCGIKTKVFIPSFEMYTLAGHLANVYISQLLYALAEFGHQLQHIYNQKKQLKVIIIGILEEIDFYY